ncbi:MAG: histone [Candidatus Altiarchaeota archaeon]|nr:histone [Candidatus Altiarchaeota archaeon]
MPETLPTSPFKRILKETGMRVSEDAADALAEMIEELGLLMIEEAQNSAGQQKRKTIRPADIKEAQRRLW